MSSPLDPRVLANVVKSYEGETLQVAECDVPVYHGNGRLEFKTGFTYVGDFVLGRMHGTGRIEWHTNGVVYEGDFTHSEITGKGTYSWPNGSSYVGDVKCGKRHGRGVFVTGDRGVLLQATSDKDQVEDDEAPKPMLFAFRSNEEYSDREGASRDEDKPNNVVVAHSNARYDGEWENGLPHGYGELVFDAVRNIRYEGQFVNGKRDGRGHMHYADGSVYVGGWKADVKCGRGVMTWMTQPGADELPNPENVIPLERYDGEWENDYQQGFGRHVWLATPLNGLTTENESSASSSPHDKNWYEGDFHQGLRHGRGVFYYANGARYEGEWKTNVKEGYGLFFYEDGRVFVGLFRQDRSAEGSYATAATTSLVAPVSSPFISPTESTASLPLSPLQSSSSSNVTGIMLFINDLLPLADVPKREKARKAVEHAALRINTELRALYRGCIKESRRSATSSNDPDDIGSLLEIFECRLLLSQCGFYFTNGQLESFMKDIRKAQRASALACASSMNIVEKFTEDLPAENRLKHPADPSQLEVVPSDELLLYREFVELLVRIAHSWVMTAEADGMINFSVGPDSTVFLADVFSDLYDQMMRERQEIRSQNSPTWLSLLRTELMGKKLHSIFTKHRDCLRSFLYSSCSAPSVCRQSEDTPELESDELESHTPIAKYDEVSIRSVLAMLRNNAPPNAPVFTADFQVRDALSALNQAFASSSPPLKSELLRIVATGSSSDDNDHDNEPDAFFLGTTLVFSEFLEALAIVLYTKQSMALEQSAKNPSKHQTPHELPLHVLVDEFVHGINSPT
ncbi:Radial spoke head protein [Phytophthora megakarya]|uniref:Radial spoke head protein n=1 Tax=Phytophthora megakarya TaxID=4795 RepID=A0A225WDW5_9STRA|nr:Radial spoke head protein [Phytophthora megakarya]